MAFRVLSDLLQSLISPGSPASVGSRLPPFTRLLPLHGRTRFQIDTVACFRNRIQKYMVLLCFYVHVMVVTHFVSWDLDMTILCSASICIQRMLIEKLDAKLIRAGKSKHIHRFDQLRFPPRFGKLFSRKSKVSLLSTPKRTLFAPNCSF